ncbi:DNA-binding protein [Microbacterium sp.]|uniref:DNA-binding protein n=1 Tax=Microbacterium sp. TaxID=51671 RepID=UPI0039E402BF
MFVLTIDQKASRDGADLVPAALAHLAQGSAERLLLAPERTVGDEIQVACRDAATALSIALDFSRRRHWSIGIGVGAVDAPLPDTIRAARGTAFIRARDAVERAKRTPTRLAITGNPGQPAEALVRLLIELRDRRSEKGWQIYDLLESGLTRQQAADALGISAAAVSLRAKAAALAAEQDALPALADALASA